MTPAESLGEMEGYNKFLLKWMGYVLVFLFGLGMGLWIDKTYACGDLDTPPPIEIKAPAI